MAKEFKSFYEIPSKQSRTRIMEQKVLDIIGEYDKKVLGKRELMDVFCKLLNREIETGKAKAKEEYKKGYDEGYLF